MPLRNNPFDSIEGAVKQIWVWQHANSGSFCTMAILLYRKADATNRCKLDSIFPCLGPALALWDAAADQGEALFKVYGVTGEADL